MSQVSDELARQIAEKSDVQLKQVRITQITPDLRCDVEGSPGAGTLSSNPFGWTWAVGDMATALYNKAQPFPILIPI